MKTYTDKQLQAIAENDDLLNKEIKKVRYFFKKKADWVSRLIEMRRTFIKERNINLKSEVDKRYFCGTCGSRDGLEHPISAYCFHCDTDNWYNKETEILD